MYNKKPLVKFHKKKFSRYVKKEKRKLKKERQVAPFFFNTASDITVYKFY